jgi:hypothetical protein
MSLGCLALIAYTLCLVAIKVRRVWGWDDTFITVVVVSSNQGLRESASPNTSQFLATPPTIFSVVRECLHSALMIDN